LKRNKSGEIEEEGFQIIDIDSFCCAPHRKYQILHIRANAMMHPMEVGRTYKFYHSLWEV